MAAALRESKALRQANRADKRKRVLALVRLGETVAVAARRARVHEQTARAWVREAGGAA